IWTQQRFLKENVYVQRTQSGEMRVVKQIETSLFVQFHGWFLSTNHVCLVMEYCPLGDISQCFSGTMSEITARTMCEQLLEGLVKLHEMKITHRDLKPQNVLVVCKDPIWVKIADFDISKRALEGETQLRSRVGTEGYMAPETLGFIDDGNQSSSYTNAVDIWSLGCLVYYALTGNAPFQNSVSLRDYAWEAMEFPEKDLIQKRVSRSGREFIKKMLALEPKDRPVASAGLIQEWAITSFEEPGLDSNEEIRDENPTESGTTESSISTNQTDSTRTTSPGPSLPTVQTIPLDNTEDDEDVDYHSSELWYLMLNPQASSKRIIPLLDLGANPNKRLDGRTALHLAVKHDTVENLQTLLDYGADTTLRCRPQEEIALHIAANERDVDKLMLLASRPGINIQNADGDTAISLAVARFKSAEAVQLLLVHGAKANIKGRHGRTPLLYAIVLDQEEKADVILREGGDPNARDKDGRTALHLAVLSQTMSLQFLKRLIDAGASVNAEDNCGHTPLYEAAFRHKRDVMALLVERGASVSLGDSGLERRVRRLLSKGGLSALLPWALGTNRS
ncbi:kinase-like protein, partial [Aspergillus campestris IBT 28561]